MSFSVDIQLLVSIQRYVYVYNMIYFTKKVAFSFLIATFVMSVFLLTCNVCSTKIGKISDISECFANFVSQILGVLARIYAAESI